MPGVCWGGGGDQGLDGLGEHPLRAGQTLGRGGLVWQPEDV